MRCWKAAIRRYGRDTSRNMTRGWKRCAGKCCCEKAVGELSGPEILAHLAWIFLSERMSAGFLDAQIRSGELKKLLRRYLELTEVDE